MGMSEDVKEHLSNVLSTKDWIATAAGLASLLAMELLADGGHITVESELAKGTAVRHHLPEVAAPPRRPTEKRPKIAKRDRNHSGGETTSACGTSRADIAPARLQCPRGIRADEAKRLMRTPQSILSSVTSCSLTMKRVRLC